METVFVTGATGFIGHHVCRALVAAGYAPVGLVRRRPNTAHQIAGTTYVEGDVTNAASVAVAFPRQCRIAVHLVGIIAENRAKGQTFERVHVGGTQAVLDAAHAGLHQKPDARFVYVSAQGADLHSASGYSRTKAEAEQRVQASGIPYTILRPSLVLGPGGDFVTQMEQLIRRPPLSPLPLPFVPVPGTGQNRFQPVWGDDLAQAVVASLSLPKSAGQVIPVGGQDIVTFDALLQGFMRQLHVKKPLLHIPLPVMRTGAAVLERLLPVPPITRDQLLNLQIDNVTDNRLLQDVLGIKPQGFEDSLRRLYAG